MSKNESLDDSEEESRHFMVNVVEPQFNLHSEDANVSFQTSYIELQCILEYLKLIIILCRGDLFVVSAPIIKL